MPAVLVGQKVHIGRWSVGLLVGGRRICRGVLDLDLNDLLVLHRCSPSVFRMPWR